MPIFLILILNILLYIFYVGVVSIIVSFLFPLVRKMLGLAVLNPYEHIELFNGIQYFIFVAVLVISLLFFRHFYVTRQVQLQRDEPRINGIKLMLVLANSFIALLYTMAGMLIGKYIGAILISDETIESAKVGVLAMYSAELIGAGIILIVSIVLRKKAYFTFTNSEYELYEAAISEVEEEEQTARKDKQDELHIKIK